MALIRTSGGASVGGYSESGTISNCTMEIDVSDYNTLNMSVSNDDNYQTTTVAVDGTTIGTSSKDSPGLSLVDYDLSSASTLTITASVQNTAYGTSRTYSFSLS